MASQGTMSHPCDLVENHPAELECLTFQAAMLPLLGISPVLGRSFLPEEDQPHGPPVVMISYALWQGHYGGDRQIIGREINIDGKLVQVVGVLLYPLCKRFTWLVHFVLGAVDGLAPLGAYIGVTGTVSASAFLLFGAVTLWVAGFDIAYALMDLPTDREQHINSVPARFGERAGRWVPIALHAVMAAMLALAGVLGGAGWLYYTGVAAAIVLTVYENRLYGVSENVFVMNERIFTGNMAFSVVFLAATLGGYLVH